MTTFRGTKDSIILRIEVDQNTTFITIAAAINEAGGDIIAVDMVSADDSTIIRDVTVNVSDDDFQRRIVEAIKKISGVELVDLHDRTFYFHRHGKLEVKPKVSLRNRDDLSRVYTPGVARICQAINEDDSKAYSLTIKRNTVAVVSDGTAVLGLGDIGPLAAMPVMEGKAMLFKEMANVDSFPICLDTKDTEEIIKIVKAIAPAFGGINLEDISSPRCFEIEERLKNELDIPVFHDDQHGTAVVMMAGLVNALKIVDKKLEDIKVIFCGTGAAGVACTKMLMRAGVKNLIGVTRSVGVIHKAGSYNNPVHRWFAEHTNPDQLTGTLSDVINGADVFIGVSGPGMLTVADVKKMGRDPIVFAMANPLPEIDPQEAQPYVKVMATGRSDYPNQINNVLCFPGIFRGALDCQATTINEEMKLAAAYAIASIVKEGELNEQYIIPSVFNKEVVKRVRNEVILAAINTGVARKVPREFRQ